MIFILRFFKKHTILSLVIFLFSPLMLWNTAHAEKENLSNNKIKKLPNYYSESNLIRINKINEDIAKLNLDAAVDPKQPLRQKHAPLIILSDPLNAEEHSQALQSMIYDSLYADFKPLILFTASILKRLLQTRNEKFIDIENTLSKSYYLYNFPNTQFFMLVPHWFKTFYQSDHGLNMYIDQTHLLTKIPDLIKKIDDKINDKNLEELFITDIKKVFRPDHNQAATPIWDIWFEGHGNTDFAICGLYIKTFQEVLNIFSEQLPIGTLYIESCFVGGNNTFTLMDKLSQKPLPYHIILGTIGETKSHKEFPSRKKSIFAETNNIISTFFHNAAHIEELDVLQSKKTQDKYLKKIKEIKEISQEMLLKKKKYELKYISNLAFYNMLQSLTKRITTNVGSLHGSEYLPQFKIKESKQFKTLEEEPGFFIIKKNKSENIDIPSSINTVIIYDKNIKNLNLYSFKLVSSFKRVHPQIEMVIRKNKYIYPSFIIIQKTENESEKKFSLSSWLYSKETLDTKKASLTIDSLTLHNEKDKKSGIMTFFESAFLTTLIQGKYVIKINRLSGPDDLSQKFFSTSLASAIQEQKTKTAFKKNQLLTLTDVQITTPHIINKTETFIISFSIEDQPFSLTYQYNEKTMIWELLVEDFNNPKVIIPNIFGEYPLQTIIKNPSFKMDEKKEYINALLIRNFNCNISDQNNISPLAEALLAYFNVKSFLEEPIDEMIISEIKEFLRLKTQDPLKLRQELQFILSDYYSIIESLLKAGADMYYKKENIKMLSPYEYIKFKEDAKLLKLFEEYEAKKSDSDKESHPKSTASSLFDLY